MLSIYSQKLASNRRSIIATHAPIESVQASEIGVRMRVREDDSDTAYVIHLTREAVLLMAEECRRVPVLNLPAPAPEPVSAPAPAPEPVSEPETSSAPQAPANANPSRRRGRHTA